MWEVLYFAKSTLAANIGSLLVQDVFVTFGNEFFISYNSLCEFIGLKYKIKYLQPEIKVLRAFTPRDCF